MKVAIIGGDGNMGRRYQAILSDLDIEYYIIDVKNLMDQIAICENCDAFIIATPTSDHTGAIRFYAQYKKPILCEKPLSKDLEELKEIEKILKEYETPFKMVMQYKFLPGYDPNLSGFSYYNYFNHGKDGLEWDCIQIVGLANGQFCLNENSPIWSCKINGASLNIEDMDRAYINMIKDWIDHPSGNFEEIYKMHEKVEKYSLANY